MKELGGGEVSIFVGETHNSDMHWLAHWDGDQGVQDFVRVAVSNTRTNAQPLARSRRRPSRFRFLSASLLGALLPLSLYGGLAAMLLR